jgi:hypothetical protein
MTSIIKLKWVMAHLWMTMANSRKNKRCKSERQDEEAKANLYRNSLILNPYYYGTGKQY